MGGVVKELWRNLTEKKSIQQPMYQSSAKNIHEIPNMSSYLTEARVIPFAFSDL
jgi:hypothetical protein